MRCSARSHGLPVQTIETHLRVARTAASARPVSQELLNSLPAVHFSRIDVSRRIDGESVKPVELTDLATRPANPIQFVQVFPVDNVKRAVCQVPDVEAGLSRIGRKRGRAGGAAYGLRGDVDLTDEAAFAGFGVRVAARAPPLHRCRRSERGCCRGHRHTTNRPH